MTPALKILRTRVPAGGFGRPLTSTELRDIRSAGHSGVSRKAVVVQNGADYAGIVYYPAGERQFSHSGILVELR